MTTLNQDLTREKLSAESQRLFRRTGISLSDPRRDASRRLGICGLVMAGLCTIALLMSLLMGIMRPEYAEELGITAP